jgi:hypothetical protein
MTRWVKGSTEPTLLANSPSREYGIYIPHRNPNSVPEVPLNVLIAVGDLTIEALYRRKQGLSAA